MQMETNIGSTVLYSIQKVRYSFTYIFKIRLGLQFRRLFVQCKCKAKIMIYEIVDLHWHWS